MNKFNPSQSILKNYLKEPVRIEDINLFRDSLKRLLNEINEDETEEFNKNLVIHFLRNSLYRDRHFLVNTYGRTDLAIYVDAATQEEHPVVLFEVKGPGRPDMVSHDNMNKKAMHELVLYYLIEEVEKKNNDIKHLIITDCRQFFIFEKKEFFRLFAKNKSFAKRVIDAYKQGNDTAYIYSQIIAPEVERKQSMLQYTYIDLNTFKKGIEKDDIIKSHKFIAAYKLFSPVNLLHLSFASDHNTLNNNFYRELLYIMGVKEVTDDKVKKIKRLGKDAQPYSLVEQAYSKLDDYSFDDDDSRFDAALGLVLIWINRILFLKLLESQLVSFTNDSACRFLDINHIPGYDELSDLFSEVLAKPIADRKDYVKTKFQNVPYLNSSLFERNQLEITYFAIGELRLGEIDVYERTVLKNANGNRLGGRLNTIDYLFRFLDAYDFGAEHNNDIVREDSKTIINASVLGLIFEKINGYKDGAFFTPGYITEYMCSQTLKRTVVQKFNEVKGWQCGDFEELKEHVVYRDRESRTEANNIINSIRICDPAVGSGHFLVSALNTLIAIKSELGVLQDHSDRPKRIQEYDISVENDELVVSDEDGDMFRYNPSDPGSQRIQETLFEEKRTIIENCLFGVDLNPKSVDICQLRLWIELLKNSYYYHSEDGTRQLQTLPNIDINIKCGNSLASHKPVTIGRKVQAGFSITKDISDYKKLVAEYKASKSKLIKKDISKKISVIKQKLNRSNDSLDLFIDQTEDIAIYRTMSKSLEWMMEFPEVLGDDGTLIGFDVVIGNPPYISLEKLPNDTMTYESMQRLNEKNQKVKNYRTLASRGDIYLLFVERGLQLLKKGGLLSYIMPNKWTKVMYGRELRQLFLDYELTSMVDFCDYQIFSDATTYTCIIEMCKQESNGTINISSISDVKPSTLAEDIENSKEIFPAKEMDNGIWITSSLDNFKKINKLKVKMNGLGKAFNIDAKYGIKPGLSEMFLINDMTYSTLISDPTSSDIIRPFLQGRGLTAFGKAIAGSHLLYIPKGFTLNGMGIDLEKQEKPDEAEAWEWFSQNYPAVSEWLGQFADKARRRTDKGDYWWELRACAYYDKFESPKIFYQVFQTKPCFVYDEASTFCNNSMYFLPTSDKALLAFLNSSTGWWLISEFCPRIQGGYQLIWDNFSQIPIPSQLPSEWAESADALMETSASDDLETFAERKAALDKQIADKYDALLQS
ncbi:MAG: Eco57I restriction-modification methylase domain-containing protein [Prevotella sp.]